MFARSAYPRAASRSIRAIDRSLRSLERRLQGAPRRVSASAVQGADQVVEAIASTLDRVADRFRDGALGVPRHHGCVRWERRRAHAALPQLDFIQEFGFVLRGLQPKIDQSCIATFLLLPHQRPESQLCAGIAPAVHNGPWPVIAWPLAIGLLRISVAPSV
jgi:hypothetical protein